MEIRRIELSDEVAFRNFQALLLAEKAAGNVFVETKKVDDFVAFVEKSKRFETQTDNPDWSTSTSYYAFIDGEIAGRIGCRWELDKGDLATVGGSIGYVVSPKYRQQGVATALLNFALEEYHKRGIDKVLITANVANLPSRRTAEKLGGQLENIITLPNDYSNPMIAGETLARYWITL